LEIVRFDVVLMNCSYSFNMGNSTFWRKTGKSSF